MYFFLAPNSREKTVPLNPGKKALQNRSRWRSLVVFRTKIRRPCSPSYTGASQVSSTTGHCLVTDDILELGGFVRSSGPPTWRWGCNQPLDQKLTLYELSSCNVWLPKFLEYYPLFQTQFCYLITSIWRNKKIRLFSPLTFSLLFLFSNIWYPL